MKEAEYIVRSWNRQNGFANRQCQSEYARFSKNVLQLLYIIAHEIIVSNSVSKYTHGLWKVSDACASLMSCITEQESAKNMSGFIIGMNGNSLF